MLRTLHVEGGAWKALEGDPLAVTGMRWVDIIGATDGEFDALEHRFNFHPLAVEDARHLDQRSKVEDYGDHVFVVLHTFSSVGGSPTQLVLHELHVFLRDDLIVTVHADAIEAVSRTWDRAVRGDASGCRGPGAVLQVLADELVDEMYPVVDGIDASVEDLGERMLGVRPDPALINSILAAKGSLRQVRQMIGPAREVLGQLCRVRYVGVSDQDMVYFRNVLDHLHVMQQQVELAREHVADVRDLYLTAQAARTNEIVKRLSVMATLGVPLTVVTGFFGMNFTALPFDSLAVLQAALAAMVVVPASIFLFMRWRRWV